MGKTEVVKQTILDMLGKSGSRKSDLKSAVKAKLGEKKKFKKALKKLVEAGEIVCHGEVYRVVNKSEQQDTSIIPIGTRVRQKTEHSKKVKGVSFDIPEVDIDDEIKRLEAELQQDDSSDGSASELESDQVDGSGVLALSQFADDRIEQLPEVCLPTPGKYSAHDSSDPHRKNRGQKKLEQVQLQEDKAKKDGLKEAVQELLSGYKARSSERLPFYCRFCSKQFTDEESFLGHKLSDFHKTAVEMERKATFCRLCIKQLTSPAQMKEHLASRPHKERLQAVRTRQRSEAKMGKGKRNRHRTQWS